jgi:Ca2+-binding RTX toxin-like protein
VRIEVFLLAAGETKTVQLNADPPPADRIQVCGGSSPTIVGTAGRDVLVGTEGNDIISAGGGNDTINGMGGNGFLFGEAGSDSGGDRGLIGGPGTDCVHGGCGIDTCDAETAPGGETPQSRRLVGWQGARRESGALVSGVRRAAGGAHRPQTWQGTIRPPARQVSVGSGTRVSAGP